MRKRVITALLILPVVLLPILSASPWPVLGLALLLTVLGHREISRMLLNRVWWVPILGTALLAVAGTLYVTNRPMLATYFQPPLWVALWAALISLPAYLQSKLGSQRYGGLQTELASAVWLIIPLLCMVWLHQQRSIEGAWNTRTALLLAILPPSFGDIAAILVGRKFGRHPFAPKISPKKTWEGSIANLVTATAVGMATAYWIDETLWVGAACGALGGILGQAGDLYESVIKRNAGVKDSGTLLPGHGGVMDRIDSILFTAPAVSLVIFLFGGHR